MSIRPGGLSYVNPGASLARARWPLRSRAYSLPGKRAMEPPGRYARRDPCLEDPHQMPGEYPGDSRAWGAATETPAS